MTFPFYSTHLHIPCNVLPDRHVYILFHGRFLDTVFVNISCHTAKAKIPSLHEISTVEAILLFYIIDRIVISHNHQMLLAVCETC